jgi:hypothetical protein
LTGWGSGEDRPVGLKAWNSREWIHAVTSKRRQQKAISSDRLGLVVAAAAWMPIMLLKHSLQQRSGRTVEQSC